MFINQLETVKSIQKAEGNYMRFRNHFHKEDRGIHLKFTEASRSKSYSSAHKQEVLMKRPLKISSSSANQLILRARICKPFREPRNRFPTLAESIPELLKCLQIRALCLGQKDRNEDR
jgi:hypothetical protein